MVDSIVDAMRHNAWANRRILESCKGLEQAHLATETIPGTYGSILATLQHIIGSESFYRFLFTGDFLDWRWDDNRLPSLQEVERWAGDLAAYWESLLSRPFDPDLLLVRDLPGGSRREVRAGVVLAQVLHHANAHREQLCLSLSKLGLDAPDLSAWAYGRDVGRDSLTTN